MSPTIARLAEEREARPQGEQPDEGHENQEVLWGAVRVEVQHQPHLSLGLAVFFVLVYRCFGYRHTGA